MKSSTSYIIIFSAVVLWCTMLVVPALVASVEPSGTGLSASMYGFFSPICHQLDSRSLHLFGHKLAVCSRCSGIYFGFLCGIVLLPLLPALRRRRWWIAAALPMIVDVVLGTTGLHESSIATRLVSGGAFGIIAACLIVPLCQEAMSEFYHRIIPSLGAKHELEA